VTDADFYGDIEVIQAGSEHWSIQHISAQRPETLDGEQQTNPPVPGPGVVFGVGNAGNADPYYGVWTNVNSLTTEDGNDNPTQDALNSQAQRGVIGRTPVPIEIEVPSGAGFGLSATIGINDLVAGVEMPVVAKLNIRQVSQLQVLDELKVTETSAGETVAVSLTPVRGAVVSA
jgi:hypothetical protein